MTIPVFNNEVINITQLLICGASISNNNNIKLRFNLRFVIISILPVVQT